MKLLAFAATNSRESINKQLVDYATRLIADGVIDDGDAVEVSTIDLNDFEMPIYSVDRERDGGIPQQARDFYDAVGGADAILISFAEHNGFYTTAYKNVFDWASRIDARVYQDKPAVLVSTSPGPGGGANVLDIASRSGQFFGYDVKATVAVPSFYDNFDVAAGSIADEALDAAFRDAIGSLGRATR